VAGRGWWWEDYFFENAAEVGYHAEGSGSIVRWGGWSILKSNGCGTSVAIAPLYYRV
jgi:hypothetical protein